MKSLANIILIFVCFSTLSLAQKTGCNCIADLKFVFKKVQKAPSYKKQIKGNEKRNFTILHQQLLKEAQGGSTIFQCFKLLTRQLAPIKDNHMFIRGNESSFSSDKLKDQDFVNEFKTSLQYRLLPEVNWNLDSLTQVLSLMPYDSIEGIYYFRKVLKLALLSTAKKDSLHGILLQSALASWEPGQVMMHLQKEETKDVYQTYTGRFIDKNLIHFSDLHQPGELLRFGWKKDPSRIAHYRATLSDHTFDLQSLQADVQYLKLGSFNSFGKSLRAADQFYEKIADKITAPNIIVDLRNNSGGGDRASKQFLKLLQKHAKSNRIFVLVNYLTISNAEQFTVKIRQHPNVQVVGMRTNGTLSYGRNKPNQWTLPSKHFTLSLTDVDYTKFLTYEEVGLEVDIALSFSSDWIAQVLKIINQ